MRNKKPLLIIFILAGFALVTLVAFLIVGGLFIFNHRSNSNDSGFSKITQISPEINPSDEETSSGNDYADVIPTFTMPAPQEQATVDALEDIHSGEPSPYWITVQDPNYGFRFAIPCFWNAYFPDIPDFSYTIQNYPPEYVNEFPRGEGVFDAGGIKLDIDIWDPHDWGQPGGQPIEKFVRNLYDNDSETALLTVDHLLINNQPAALVTTESIFGIGQFYLFPYADDTFLMIGASQKLIQHPDVQHIIYSFALTPDIEVHIPSEMPADPPSGLSAPCMGVNGPVSGSNESNPDCLAHSYTRLQELNIALTNALNTRDYDSLAYSIANNPTTISYWQSEGGLRTPDEIYSEFSSSILPASFTTPLTFTSDRASFPSLLGVSPDSIYGPTLDIADIIYATGFGPDGKAEALLYLARDTCGFFYWHAIVYARNGFGD